MKHEEKDMQTKRALAAALKTLLTRKRLSKITISDITRECGVNRKTFYYHFTDIGDLLSWILDTDAIQIVKSYDLKTDIASAAAFAFDYIDHNSYLINCALDDVGQESLKRYSYANFSGVVRSGIDQFIDEHGGQTDISDDYLDFIYRFYTGALVSLLIDYARRPSEDLRKRTIEYTNRLLQDTIPAAVHLI